MFRYFFAIHSEGGWQDETIDADGWEQAKVSISSTIWVMYRIETMDGTVIWTIHD